LIRPKIAIPEHYGTFPVLVQTSDGFKKQARKLAPHVKVMDVKPGVRVEV
ncbi:MAG: MBL fold metallo-hydrolase, partial [Deltaproteobacteria bacterium]|nr:MBL fold metallo-hydrolase [Deltaproteobacteria bacterium]